MQLSASEWPRGGGITKKAKRLVMVADNEDNAEDLARLFWAFREGRIQIMEQPVPIDTVSKIGTRAT